MNFDYIKPFPSLKKLYEFCAGAEECALHKPALSVTSARMAMEYIARLVYESLVGDSSDVTVFEILSDPRFIACVNSEALISSFHFVRKIGNLAVHTGEVYSDDSKAALEQLHFIVGELCIQLGLVKDYPPFVKPGLRVYNNAAAPAGNAPVAQTSAAASPVPAAAAPSVTAAPEAKNDEPEEPVLPKSVEVEPDVVAAFAPRMRATSFNVQHGRDEQENKLLFLRASLREAGWPIVNTSNQAFPCAAGINMLLYDGDKVDYVLFGRDNKPLAIIEYTSTSQNIVEGRTKAIEQANKMAQVLGYKPIAYYTNGYYIFVIDQLGFLPRRVFQFHTIEELELLKLRAGIMKDISNPVIDDAITNREYQKTAIRAACRAFTEKRRRSLLVMATGTGKTRIAISLTDVLMKANRVKNVLFLADRTSLVRQAHKNFNKLLPSVTTSIYAGGSFQRDPNARIIFSTYQTMVRLINDDTREFSIGRFDLIIVDEAHRSIFKKYGSLFHYFDSLVLGLTATPRGDENKSTYAVFGLENGNPDFAYELEQAIDERYLVGFSVLDRTTDALRRGFYYDEMSDEEKEAFEDTFASGDKESDEEEGTEERRFDGSVVKAQSLKSARYVSLGTIDAMLGDLMKNGLKVNGGDKLGKTVIFAKSHLEAEKIVERFLKLYPHLGTDFCKLIDCRIQDSLKLIDNFGERDVLPQVVVSVDMMDTGIDVPDILNLVFFKGVYSKVKFLQMIGRGTRLSPDVFGPGLDKKGFLVFDYYDNFDFFRTRNTWRTVDETQNGSGSSLAGLFNITPQSVLINETKLSILYQLIKNGPTTSFEATYLEQLRDYFLSTVRSLCTDDVEVQYNMAYVSKYRTAEQWNRLSKDKVEEIKQHILPLFPANSDPARVKNFDLLILTIEEAVPRRMLEGKDVTKVRFGHGNACNEIDKMICEVLKLKTIPEVMSKEPLLKQMHHADYLFECFTLERCEKVRSELRDLMSYIPDDRRYYIINAKDTVIDTSGAEEPFVQEKNYVERAVEYINKPTPALLKIRMLDELTDAEKDELETVFKTKLGTASDYAAWSGNKPLLPFLRVQVGIADEAIKTKFGTFLNEEVLNEQQMIYMNQIIRYVRENGDIAFLDLQKVSPFCDVDVMSLFGEKVVYIKTLVNGLHKPVM